MIDTIIEFCKTNVEVIAAAGVLITAVVFIKNEFFGLFSKKPKLELSADAAQAIAATATPSVDEPHVVEFLRIRKAMKADLEEEFKEATEKDKAPLLARIAELERQIASPDEALLEAQKRIKDLEALLDREGNDIGAERIEAAKAALEQEDYSLADEIFADIEARAEPEVQRAARAAYGRGEVAEAEIRWQDAATHYARAAQLNPSFDTLRKASDFAERSGDYTAALRHSDDLVKLAENGTLTDEQRAASYNEHALNLDAQGQYEAAEQLYRQALEIGEKTIGVDHPSYAIRLNNLAEVLRAQGHYEAAEKLFRQAMAIGKKTIGVDHPTYANHLNNLAGVFQAQGQYEAAEEYLRQALAIDEKTIGVDHPSYAIRLNNLATVLEAQGQYAAAEEYFRQAMATTGKSLGVDHPDYATRLNNLAGVLYEQGQYEAAEGYYRRAIQILETALGDAHPNTITVRENLGELLAKTTP